MLKCVDRNMPPGSWITGPRHKAQVPIKTKHRQACYSIFFFIDLVVLVLIESYLFECLFLFVLFSAET